MKIRGFRFSLLFLFIFVFVASARAEEKKAYGITVEDIKKAIGLRSLRQGIIPITPVHFFLISQSPLHTLD